MRFNTFSLLPALTVAYPYFHTSKEIDIETRSLDELHKAAVAEGGVVTLWHGGDEKNQQNALKQAFEKRFPDMTLNVTVDVSKYHDVNIDEQLAQDNLYVDIAMLQTLQDYPRWKEQGVLMPYKPAGFDHVFLPIKDFEGYYTATSFFFWPLSYVVSELDGPAPTEYTDFLRPEFKNKLILTYPNDDDAVLYGFDKIIRQYGTEWFDALRAQNPRWVRGSATPIDVMSGDNNTEAGTFCAFGSLTSSGDVRGVLPTEGHFTSWAQTGAIFSKAPHPAAAKLLMNFVLGEEWQTALSESSWSIRDDIKLPKGFDKNLFEMNNTDPLEFDRWMQDRDTVERLRFWYESRIGTPQGKSPLEDNL